MKLNWSGENEVDSIGNDRLYEVYIEGKEPLTGSADEVFFGNPKLYNPEDLLLSALASCHMMSYFYVCRKRGVSIKSYQDNPEGVLKLEPDGSGKFESVTLKPIVELVDKTQVDLAVSLHKDAGRLCFIANSCSFKIAHSINVY